jgi:hypothetical protein
MFGWLHGEGRLSDAIDTKCEQSQHRYKDPAHSARYIQREALTASPSSSWFATALSVLPELRNRLLLCATSEGGRTAVLS